MKLKVILPGLPEATRTFCCPSKPAFFPPLGLVMLADYLEEDSEVVLQDDHFGTLDLNDEPDLVAIQVHLKPAYRAYEIADHYRRKGVYVCLGGLHVTAQPEEAAQHADTIFIGSGRNSWLQFLADLRTWFPRPVYRT